MFDLAHENGNQETAAVIDFFSLEGVLWRRRIIMTIKTVDNAKTNKKNVCRISNQESARL